MVRKILNISAWGVSIGIIGFGIGQCGGYIGISSYCGGPRQDEPANSDWNQHYFQCRRDALSSMSFAYESTLGFFSIPNIVFGCLGFAIGLAYGLYRNVSFNHRIDNNPLREVLIQRPVDPVPPLSLRLVVDEKKQEIHPFEIESPVRNKSRENKLVSFWKKSKDDLDSFFNTKRKNKKLKINQSTSQDDFAIEMVSSRFLGF